MLNLRLTPRHSMYDTVECKWNYERKEIQTGSWSDKATDKTYGWVCCF